MNCECCPHQAEINAELKQCQSCEHGCRHLVDCESGRALATYPGHPENCKSCPRMKVIQMVMRPCGVCETGKLHGTVHFDAASSPQTVWEKTLPIEHTSSTGVTPLEPDTEDELRKAFAIVFDLTPLELLLIQHVMHRRTPATFRETLVMLRDRLNTRYDLSEGSRSFRSICNVWKNKIVEKLPLIEDLFAAVIDEAKTSKHTRHVTEEEFGDD